MMIPLIQSNPQTKLQRAIQPDRWVFLAALFGLAVTAFPQQVPVTAAPPVAPAAPASVKLTDAQLQTLLAPIALYPDALVAQILPASTYPLQVVVAQRWLQANPNPTEVAIDAQDLEPSLKALLHYPTVLAMMSDRILWTQSLGVAFLNQQGDVMNAIQELRQQARAAGSLQSTPQQQVVIGDDDIEIVPTNPEEVFVPDYDPLAIYGDNYGVGITFGLGYPEGLWLDNGVDWHHRWIAGGSGWHHGWDNPIGDPRAGQEPPMTKPWERDSAQPLPVRPRVAIQESPHVAQGYENSREVTAAPNAFQGYQNRSAIQAQIDRAQQSRPAPQQSRPAPQVRVAPAQVFHAEGTGRSVAAQSARGNASRAASSGGGGGRRR